MQRTQKFNVLDQAESLRSICSSAPTPSYFNDDNIPDFLVKYQNGPGFPVYYSSQVLA